MKLTEHAMCLAMILYFVFRVVPILWRGMKDS